MLKQDSNGLMVNKNKTIAIRDSFMAKQFNRALGVNDEPQATPEQVCFNSIIKLWRRPGNLHWFQYWPLDHLQMFSNWSPVFVTGITTLSWIVLLVLLVGIELVSSSTSVTSFKKVFG